MIVTHFLAWALLAALPQSAPQIMQPHTSAESCLKAAAQANKEDPDVSSAEGKAAGGQWVCLTFVYPQA
jgi:hypothetical protein